MNIAEMTDSQKLERFYFRCIYETVFWKNNKITKKRPFNPVFVCTKTTKNSKFFSLKILLNYYWSHPVSPFISIKRKRQVPYVYAEWNGYYKTKNCYSNFKEAALCWLKLNFKALKYQRGFK